MLFLCPQPRASYTALFQAVQMGSLSMDRQQCSETASLKARCGQNQALELLWVQDLVSSKQLAMGQIPTEWNYSDVGTKPLSRSRLMVLLHQIGAINRSNLQMIGQEEFDAVASRLVGQQNLKRIAKTIYRMAAVWGLESLGSEAAVISPHGGTCAVENEAIKLKNSENFLLWCAMAFMPVLWVAFAMVTYKVLRQLRHDLEQCWGQVGEEDAYVAVQERRIDTLNGKMDMMDGKMDELEDKITEASHEISMTHDYCTTIHYTVVESGGFLRNGLGLSNDQWTHLNTLERASMVSHHAMGSASYMHLVRQRIGPSGSAETTDAAHPGGAEGSEGSQREMEIEPADGPLHYGSSVQEMHDALNNEQTLCSRDGEIRFSAMIQHLLLSVLQTMQDGLSTETAIPLKNRVVTTFEQMSAEASQQNKWSLADRSIAVAAIYRP